MVDEVVDAVNAFMDETNCTLANSSIFDCNFTVCSSFLDSNCTGPSLMDVNQSKRLQEFQEQSRFWVQRVLVPIIMSIGVIGNTLTIIIMTQRRMRSSTNCYLAALAIFDMSYLVFSFLLSFQHYPHINDVKYHLYWKVWPYLLTLTDASSNSSVWLTVTFTVERYIAVCHPMKGKVLCTESRAQKMIVIVFVTCFLITLPTSFEWIIIEVHANNATVITPTYSELGLNPVYVSVYYWMIAVVFIIVPFILLAFFNAFLIRSVHTSKVRRKTMTRRKETRDQAKQESKITIMLIAVVILFFVCQLPTAVILLYKSFHHVEEGGDEDLLLRGLGNIFNFLMAVNAAGNFVLYSLLSQKYRRTFVQIFCLCLNQKATAFQSAFNTVYSTVGNESPNITVKCNTKLSQNSKGKNSIAPSTRGTTPRTHMDDSSVKRTVTFPTTQPAVYSNQQNTRQQPAVDETHYRRLLRGFRCPWRRQKIASGANHEETSNQFIPLRTSNVSEDACADFENLGKSQF